MEPYFCGFKSLSSSLSLSSTHCHKGGKNTWQFSNLFLVSNKVLERQIRVSISFKETTFRKCIHSLILHWYGPYQNLILVRLRLFATWKFYYRLSETIAQITEHLYYSHWKFTFDHVLISLLCVNVSANIWSPEESFIFVVVLEFVFSAINTGSRKWVVALSHRKFCLISSRSIINTISVLGHLQNTYLCTHCIWVCMKVYLCIDKVHQGMKCVG